MVSPATAHTFSLGDHAPLPAIVHIHDHWSLVVVILPQTRIIFGFSTCSQCCRPPVCCISCWEIHNRRPVEPWPPSHSHSYSPMRLTMRLSSSPAQVPQNDPSLLSVVPFTWLVGHRHWCLGYGRCKTSAEDVWCAHYHTLAPLGDVRVLQMRKPKVPV